MEVPVRDYGGQRRRNRCRRGSAATVARVAQAQRAEFPRAEALTAEIDRLPEFVADDARTLGGVVRLSLQPSVSWPLVGDLVAAVRSVTRTCACRSQKDQPDRSSKVWPTGASTLVLSLASRSAVAAEGAAKELALSRIVSPETRQTFYLVVGARRHPSVAVQAVADLVRDLAGRPRSGRAHRWESGVS